MREIESEEGLEGDRERGIEWVQQGRPRGRGAVHCSVRTLFSRSAGPPRNGCEYYIHRSGRTGRGGRDGCAILLHSGNHADMDIIHEVGRVSREEGQY